MEYSGEYNQFVQHYFCNSFSSIRKQELDEGNKIFMPASALDRLSALNIDYPMMFSIQNTYEDCGGRISHCGVLEFTADEGFIFMPQPMMENMKILEGDLVLLKNVSLLKATYVKLQPQTSSFIDLSNPKAVLERTLIKYACLTTGDTITIPHNGEKFRIDVLETKPEFMVSIIDTDCEVDFAAPLDYKEPPEKKLATQATNPIGSKAHKAAVNQEKGKPEFTAFTGVGRRLDEEESET